MIHISARDLNAVIVGRHILETVMKKYVPLLLLLLFVLACSAPKPDVVQIEKDLIEIIKIQEAAWNEKNIEGFMAYYWKSEKLTFQSGNTRRYGWENVINMYRANYVEKEMGTLTFKDMEVHVLTNNLAFVLGRYNVKKTGSISEGLTTLIFRRMPEGWRIINDHSS